jgi:large subunit ribosomal protein L13
MAMHKTFSLKSGDVKRNWVLIDVSQAPLGRVATVIAQRLIGKYKPTYTPHIDNGDFVVVVNADKLVVTGNKEENKTYYSYSGYPSGIKSKTLAEARAKDSTKVIIAAVKGMLPKNKLAAERLKRLKVFVNELHAHEAQKPVKIEVK